MLQQAEVSTVAVSSFVRRRCSLATLRAQSPAISDNLCMFLSVLSCQQASAAVQADLEFIYVCSATSVCVCIACPAAGIQAYFAWLCYFYVAMALRESVLMVNGSHIRPWWISHHIWSAVGSLLMLALPISSPSKWIDRRTAAVGRDQACVLFCCVSHHLERVKGSLPHAHSTLQPLDCRCCLWVSCSGWLSCWSS